MAFDFSSNEAEHLPPPQGETVRKKIRTRINISAAVILLVAVFLSVTWEKAWLMASISGILAALIVAAVVLDWASPWWQSRMRPSTRGWCLLAAAVLTSTCVLFLHEGKAGLYTLSMLLAGLAGVIFCFLVALPPKKKDKKS